MARCSKSRPSRARGLKCVTERNLAYAESVAPLAGAWIEMLSRLYTSRLARVAPLAGAWIEIPLSHLSQKECEVAPLAGAWIEMAR